MTARHAAMALDASVLIALAAVTIGAGLLRGTLAAQLGELMRPTTAGAR